MADFAAVVTTIHPPSVAMERLAAAVAGAGGATFVAGDAKGPASFDLDGTVFLSLDDQRRMPFELGTLAPTGNYARKNIAYLAAIAGGATSIFETDDDTAPLDHWAPRQVRTSARGVSAAGWFNVYHCFTDDVIWPRGFPLELARSRSPKTPGPAAAVDAPVQQSLVNGEPDVDAVWRMTRGEWSGFRDEESVHLAPGSWCPFNSQATWWWADAFELLYLPATCTMRMTDIWRGLVTQRCLWAMDTGLVFHAPDVVQDRNPHSLADDFRLELAGYCSNADIVGRLEDLDLDSSADAAGDNLVRCYEVFREAGLVEAEELKLARAWLKDIGRAIG